jgi:hypothetical protein
MIPSRFSKRPGATLAGVFSVALAAVLLLCGAGSVPIENFSPQGSMQADLNAGGHSVTNAATVSGTNVIANSLAAGAALNGTNLTAHTVGTNALNFTALPPNGAASGDLSGSYPNPTVAKINGVAPTGFTAGTTNVTIGGTFPNQSISVAGGSGAPTGSAGGDLSGSYPNPTLATTSVTAGSYTNASVTVDAKGRVTAASSGTGGSGTVTTFSAGNLSPLFTTSVSSATSAPALSFTLSNAALNSVLAGPASGGAGAPSFQTAPTFSGLNLTALPTTASLYPALNQSTTGTAANVTGVVAQANGGTGITALGSGVATALAINTNVTNGFVQLSGGVLPALNGYNLITLNPASLNGIGSGVAAAIQNATNTGNGFVVLSSGLLPAINASQLTYLNASALQSGNIPIARFNGGTSASSSTFWRGDGTWATPSGGGSGVTSVSFTGDGTLFTGTAGTPVTGSGTLTPTLNNAGANTILGNSTGSSAAPAYNAISNYQGTSSTTFAAGNDSRIVGAAQTGSANTFSAAQTFSGGITSTNGTISAIGSGSTDGTLVLQGGGQYSTYSAINYKNNTNIAFFYQSYLVGETYVTGYKGTNGIANVLQSTDSSGNLTNTGWLKAPGLYDTTSGHTSSPTYFNSSGQLEPGSASGGISFNTSTGALTLSAIASGDVLANLSGSSAAPVATTGSALLDNAGGSTQGNILYRGASGWTALAPGSSGQVLSSGGASANPSWTTVSAAGQIPITTETPGNITATPNSRYMTNGSMQITLPATSSVGDTIEVIGGLVSGPTSNGNGIAFKQGSGQYIVYNNSQTTTGSTGYLTTANGNAAVKITCTVANTGWVVTSHEQTITLY